MSPELKNQTSVYDVKGRNGFFKRVITYGDYYTSKVKRGWTHSYNIPFFVTYKGAKQKLSFTQMDSTGLAADVFCVGKFKQKEFSLFEDLITVELDRHSNFTGSIFPKTEATADHWDFYLYNPDGGFIDNNTYGVAENVDGTKIQIKGVRQIEQQSQVFDVEVYGYEFFLEGNSIGAVSTINNVRVWMKNNIDNDMKLIVASLSSALMVRDNLEKAAQETGEDNN